MTFFNLGRSVQLHFTIGHFKWAYKNLVFKNINNVSKEFLTKIIVGDILNIIEI